MRFHVGQRVRLVDVEGLIPEDDGVPDGTCGQISGGPCRPMRDDYWSDVYPVVLDSGQTIYRVPEALELIDDDFRAGSWDEICALTRGWRPGVVRCG